MAHVLVIEDDPAIRSSLIRSLSDRGHAVTSAPNGLDGLRQALDGGPDLVLLDLGLPDLDGHSVLSMLRAVRDTPVIVITARDDDPSVVKASTPAPTTTSSNPSVPPSSRPGCGPCCAAAEPTDPSSR